jgi:NAD-dependent DNA ligase
MYEDLAFRKFTTRSEADKAINSLKGILVGINLDGKINEAEIKELRAWCSKHEELVNRNPFKELMQVIQQGTTDDLEEVDWIEDLLWLCDQYGQDNIYYNSTTADLQVLQGICHGILSDAYVNADEVKALRNWLEEHKHLNSYYPYDEISSLVSSVLADGVIDTQERIRLTAYFKEFVNLTDDQLTQKIALDTADITVSGICTNNPDISFDGKTFCLTGLFNRGTRQEAAEAISNIGGIVVKTVSKKTDYLIIGESGNPCWAFACYGRKVEQAITLRKKGSRVALIHEYDFWDTYEDTHYANR